MVVKSEPLITMDSNTWIDRLMINCLSYMIVILPVTFIVVMTKYYQLPILKNSIYVQWFVYGQDTRHFNSKKESNKTTTQYELLTNGEKVEKSQEKNITSHESNISSRVTKFVYCFLGLQISLLIWANLQEKIMTTKYATSSALDNNETTLSNQPIQFHDSQFLVFVNRTVAFLFAIIALLTDKSRKNRRLHIEKPPVPLFEYIYCSISNIMSSWFQYEALKYVNFPTQVMSKVCKIAPVMLMSKLILRKKYQTFDYICALLLSCGMTAFLVYQPDNTHSMSPSIHEPKIENIDIKKGGYKNQIHEHIQSPLVSGLIILGLYLGCDSFTSNWQENLFSKYQVNKWQIMAAINFYSILLTITSLSILGNLAPAIKMLLTSKTLLLDIILMALMSAVGQLFIYQTIENFGSVVLSIIMTTRALFSIVISYILYGHEWTYGSLAGLLIVFSVAFGKGLRSCSNRTR